jgi:hypothetical protein
MLDEALDVIKNHFLTKKHKKFCSYRLCLVRYFKHYHIDEHTVCFLEEKMIDGKKEVSF